MVEFLPLVFGIGAALTWGFYDYYSAGFAKKVGYQRGYFENNFSAALIGLGFILLFSKLELPASGKAQFIIFAGSALAFIGSLWAYKSFELGKVSINSPITSLYNVVTVIAVALLTKAMIPLPKLALGIAAVLCSLLAAFHTLNLRAYKMEKGVNYALLAVLIFTMSSTLPAVARSQFNELTFALLVVAVAAAGTGAMNLKKVASWVKTISLRGVGIGLLYLAGWAFYLYGINSSDAVAAVALTALFPAVPIAMSALRGEEELQTRQKLGLIAMLLFIVAFLLY